MVCFWQMFHYRLASVASTVALGSSISATILRKEMKPVKTCVYYQIVVEETCKDSRCNISKLQYGFVILRH